MLEISQCCTIVNLFSLGKSFGLEIQTTKYLLLSIFSIFSSFLMLIFHDQFPNFFISYFPSSFLFADKIPPLYILTFL